MPLDQPLFQTGFPDLFSALSRNILLFLHSSMIAARPIITPPPASVTGREGSSVTLPCEITPLDSLQELKWQRNGLDLAVSDSARYFGGTVSNPSLTILNPTDTDSGNYRCVATNQYGTSSGGVTTLDIQCEWG